MPLWGSTVDNTSSAPIFSGATVNKTPNSAVRDQLFGNVTPNGVVTGQIVSIAGIGANEIGGYVEGKPAHTGWVLRRIGTGGRAGRVHQEVLVAGGFATANNTDLTIVIQTQPQTKSVNAGAATTFPCKAFLVPNTIVLSYRWQVNSGSGFVNLATNGVYTNTTSNTLAIANVTGLNTFSYRMIVSCNTATTQTSTNATLSVA